MSDSGAPVRIGILGAARITSSALIKPARGNSEVVVAAVAARDVSRARAFAAKHGIARVHDSYEALIADPDLDAIYIPLPIGLHGRWTRAALDAGKHVLCEKPFTANAAEAREVAELAATSDRVVMEAFHYRYHPCALRVDEIIASGELGKLKRVEAEWCFWVPKSSRQPLQLLPRRWRDSWTRMLCGRHGAQVRRFDPGSRFGAGETARSAGGPGHDGRVAVCRRAHRPDPLLDVVDRSTALDRKVVGDRGELRLHPLIPFQRFSVRSTTGKRVENFPAARTTYAYQLDAFAAAVLRGEPVKTTPEEAIENMTVIDAMYRAAGLPLREPA